jgi:outer membrane receptor protein involved in Fe transport
LDAETHQPLSGANVQVVGTDLSTVTDSAGRYVIGNVPPGTQSVKVSLVGYEDEVVSGLVVVQDQTATCDASLKKTVIEVKGAAAEVTAPRVTLRQNVTATSYSVTPKQEQMSRGQPNDLYQFSGVVYTEPGVVPDASDYPHIRGAREDQVGYMLEGIPITEPNNNVFATNIVTVGLSRLELYTGGYPAQYGGYVGGIINEVVKRGDQVRGGFSDTSVGVPWNYRDNILELGRVDGRWNWYYQSNTWQSNFNENKFTSAAPASSDAIFKAIYDVGKKDKVTLLANAGYARYLFPFSHTLDFNPNIGDFVDAPFGQDYGRQGYSISAVSLSHNISARTFWSLRAFQVANWLRINLTSDIQGFWMQRQQRMNGLQFDFTSQLRPSHLLKAGVWYVPSDNSLRGAINIGAPFGPYDYTADNDTKNWRAYLGDSWKASDRLTFDLGVRYDRMNYDRPTFPTLTLSKPSPRLGATYLLSPSTLLRASWGKHVEMPPAQRVGVVFADNFPDQRDILSSIQEGRSDLKPQTDTCLDLGFERKVGRSSLLSATYFRRKSSQVTQRWAGASDDVLDLEAPFRYASNGRGLTTGLELKLDRRLSHEVTGWLSYTYMKARATSNAVNQYPFGSPFGFNTGNVNDMFYVDWDQRHTAALALNWRRGKFDINPWIGFGSGYMYGQSGADVGGDDYQHGTNATFTKDGVTYPSGTFTTVPILVNGQLQSTTPNSLRTGSHHTFSLNITYNLGPDRQVYLDLYNLLRSDRATNLVWYDPNTGAVLGYRPPEGTPSAANPGTITYTPYTVTPPFFAVIGVRQYF